MANLDQLSLLHSEARERAASLAVRHTQVELDLTAPGDTFGSTTTIDFDCSVDQLRTFVDFKGDQLRSAALDGEVLDPGSWRQGRLPLVLTAGSHTLVLDGLMRYSSDGEGLHRHVDPADGRTYLYAMSFLDAGPRWFGCFDQPDLKSTYQWDVRAPEDWVVLGNGPSQVVEPGWWRIISRHPLATYHVTLVAGPYVSILDSHDEIPLGVHARASLAEALSAEAADIFEVTKASFDYYHRMFGVRYPFGEYHQVFVADFNAGAMENPGCVTLRDQLIFRGRATAAERSDRADVVAHELAHMWFGNLVTMRWWDDLWLNESFAEYSAQRCCTEATHYPQWTAFGIVRKDWGMVADQAPSTHPVAGNPSPDAQSALQAFDGISYAKGAAVLKQLVALLGERVFLDGLRSYFDRYVFGNAELADLLAAWSRSGAVDLDSWAQQWLRTSGLDTVEVELSPTGGRLRRIGSSAAPAERHHALRAAAYDSAGTKLSETAVVLGNRLVPIELPGASAFVVPDAADDTWAKVRFGDGPATLAPRASLTRRRAW
jgi:aminopeptidase N